MQRGCSLKGCSPNAASVLCGAALGAIAAITSGQGFNLRGVAWLLGGYVAGAVLGYVVVMGLGRAFGKWWEQ